MTLAHIMGIPVEESILQLAPAGAATVTAVAIAGRTTLGRLRRSAAGRCDVCIPPPPPDLDCGQIPYRNFRVIYNVPDPDPHRFDGEHDGIGCES
jgi:hypothetical protein